MRSLALDYQRTVTPAVRIVRLMMLAAGLAVLGAAAYTGHDRWQRLDGVRAQIEALERMNRRSAVAIAPERGDSPELAAEVRRANTVLEQLNLPWLELLDAIEATRGEKVALLSVQPDARQRIVRIAAEAQSLDEALEYARRLNRHPRLASVHFTSHETVQQDPQKPVRVQLVASWRQGR